MCIARRIKEIADREQITITEIERIIGASSGVLSRAAKNGTDIQSKWVAKIVDNFQSYSPEWLLTGKGEMLISDRNPPHPWDKLGGIDPNNRIVRLADQYSADQVAKALRIPLQELHQYLRDNFVTIDPNSDAINRIVEAFPDEDERWIRYGLPKKNEPSVAYHNSRNMEQPNVIKIGQHNSERQHDVQSIPLYAFEATAGIMAQSDVSEYVIDNLKIPNMPRCDGAVAVVGDSMYPIIKSGDIVLYKQIGDISNIIWGQMYLVSILMDGDPLILVKYINKIEGDDSHILLVSQNVHHAPLEVPLANVRSIALIKASIRYHMM